MIAVITGDIVQSTQIEDKGELLNSLKRIFKTLAHHNIISEKEYDIYRGDSFQIFIRRPETALKNIVILRALMIMSTPKDSPFFWDARVSIGLGEVDYRAKEVRQSSGSAFIYSGRGLDKMKSRQKMSVSSSFEEFNKDINMGLYLAEYIVSRWSRESAETVIEKYLYHSNQMAMAKKFNVSQPAISKRFKVAGIDALDILIRRFEKKVQQKNQQNG